MDVGAFNMCTLINVIYHINKHMNKNCMIMSINIFEKTLESPLDCKEIKPINPEGNHS